MFYFIVNSMKKSISIVLLIMIIFTNIWFTLGQYTPDQINQQLKDELSETNTTNSGGPCPGSPGCPWYEETMDDINNNSTPSSFNGMTINEDCLTNGQCKFNIYDTLGIRKSVRSEWDPTSVGLFVQDIVLSATFFIWTVVTVALMVSGLMYIFAAASGKDPSKAKKWITGALIWLVIVACSYFIIRLIQYLAKGV